VFAGVGPGENISIPADDYIVYDLPESPNYGYVHVFGVLGVWRTANSKITCAGMMVHGEYRIGTEEDPFPLNRVHDIECTGTRDHDPSIDSPSTGGGSDNRGVMFMTGSIKNWVAEGPAVQIFKLGATAEVGATSLIAEVPVTFKSGDQLELTTSKYWQEGLTNLAAIYPVHLAETTRKPGWGQEIVTVASDVTNSTTIPLVSPLVHRHHGQLQYLVPPGYEDVPGTNLSYTQRTLVSGDSYGTVNGYPITGTRVLGARGRHYIDNRAAVGLLTHPIRCSAPDDSDWTTHGYGFTLMVMGLNSQSRMKNVEINRCGKAAFLGNYPIHHHMRSIGSYGQSNSGTILGSVVTADNFVVNCSIRNSSNRAITIHGTHGVKAAQNVMCYIDTHALFLEDGSEMNNILDGNLVSGVRTIGYGKTALKVHDTHVLAQFGPSGIWYTNPHNYLRNNMVYGAFVGIWNAFSNNCFGLSREADIHPRQMMNLEWKDNEAACCVTSCMRTQPPVGAEDGSVVYGHEMAGDRPTEDTLGLDLFEGARLWKSESWYINEADHPHYDNWMCGAGKEANPLIGNVNILISGNTNGSSNGGNQGRFTDGIFAGKTLDDYYSADAPDLTVSYGNGVSRMGNIWIPVACTDVHVESPLRLPHVVNRGGQMRLWDFYLYPVNMAFFLEDSNVILGADPGYPGIRFPPLFLTATNFPATSFGVGYRAVTGVIENPWSQGNSGAVKLPADGSLFGQSGWWVHNHPFLLHGTTGAITAQAPAGATGLNGVLLPDVPQNRFYGVQVDTNNGANVLSLPINYTRLQSNGVTVVDTWNTGLPDVNNNYFNMRHAATPQGGILSIDIPAYPTPNSIRLNVFAMLDSDSVMILAHNYNGSTPVTIANLTNFGGMPGSSSTLAPVASKVALLAATSHSYWVDVSGNKIWMKLFGGLAWPSGGPTDNIQYLHRFTGVFINI
jgi:hypothetical protein